MSCRFSSARGGALRAVAALAVLCPLSASVGCKRIEKDVHAASLPAVRVDTVSAARRRAPATLPVTATIEAMVQTDLAASANGKVLVVHGLRGEEVKKGALIAQLDVRTAGLQAAAARAQANVSADQAAQQADECARYDKLARAGAVAIADLERQQWQCKVSKGSVAVSQLQAAVASQTVVDGAIKAPFDGWIVDRFVDVGEYVAPSTKVATIVSLDPLKLQLSVPEAQLPKLTEGLPISFRVGAYGDRVFSAKLVRVSPIVRPATRDVLAEAEIPNADKALRPGMFASAELPLGDVDAATVPKTAVFVRDEASHAFVVVGGRVEERAVQLGPAIGDDVVIAKGIAPGERVVRAPGPDVKNGVAVSD
jgi:membrane fusion protein (multidrug efflux system)